ncbi:putative bifunctional diguanylate cyclase/phosphodiesterase [Humitalea rosea]|uniref:putative bifunctional diguanylate cyclase/phosphodiesterase n=1 Tax=Humitalea rosea TaxID=990373 RepID=UPI001B86F504|nr:EAL domain-containing protein [Humitalea rosea]
MSQLQIRTLIRGAGLALAVIIAVGLPAGYFAVGAIDIGHTAALKARLSSDRVARYIYAHEELWQYQHVRLLELIEFPPDHGVQPRMRIEDTAGRMVVQESGALLSPTHELRVPVVVGGETIAWLAADTSLRPLLIETGYVALFGLLLGLLEWFAMLLLPLRALDKTLSALSTQSARFQAALNNMTQGLCMFDGQNRLIVHNRRFDEMFGAPDPEAARSGSVAIGMLRERGLGGSARLDGLEGGTHELIDGRVIQVSHQAMAEAGWVATYEDVTERRRSHERLLHMTRHDALTGLPNRTLFREQMERRLSHGGAPSRMAVLCIDLDGFKGVNDSLGHAAGDELLRVVARRLRDATREADIVARLGGDEFAVITELEQPAELEALAARLVGALQAPFQIQGQVVAIGASIGVMPRSETQATADELLRNADIALYRAKAEGRGTWRFFEPGMDAEILKRRQFEAELRRALIEEQFELHYQPLLAAEPQALVGFEALVRWRHPRRGLVQPGEFIPLAEEIGLIKSIGAWVLRKACADAAKWPSHIKIAVNLSPLQFMDGDPVRDVELALAASGLPAERLELEITESVLLQDNETTLSSLHRLHAMGVRISMDDFGTGYSSLSYLRRFPFDKIKIDRSFVHALAQDTGSIAIVRAVIGLGKALGMDVLAEGVETAEQLRILKLEGCDELQGYLFSRPQPVQDVAEMIARYAQGASTAEA